MKSIPKGMLKKYEELKRFHYRTLHELASAAQAIRTCEFLEKSHRQEIDRLQCVFASAKAFCQSEEPSLLMERREALRKAVAEYEAGS